ncbi:MAG: BREX-1 system adenine-specific DNA-methyltransferase PglX, partial [candidate division Zixibacteria bacterium]|nr:BREX-1 system adenine-specific DNA-methyltransferase PglX [candidate division Zixibacteria bacterium]
MLRLLHQFEEAKNFGSLIQPCLDERTTDFVRHAIEAKDLGGQLFLRETHLRVLRVLEQAEALTQRYHVVVANPPYMGWGNINGPLRGFLESNFQGYEADLFSTFIVRCLGLAMNNGRLGFMSPFVWMFIASYEKLRSLLISTTSISSLVQLEYSGFEGATVPICTFTLRKGKTPGQKGTFLSLSSFKGPALQDPKAREGIQSEKCSYRFQVCTDTFALVPSCPIAFTISDRVRSCFAEFPAVATIAEPRKGMVTADNPRFIRFWFEVSNDKTGFGFTSRESAKESLKKWFPYQKGGDFRKWAGNTIAVVNWENDGHELLHMKGAGYKVGSTNHNFDYIFKPAIVWTKITSAAQSFRVSNAGFLFDDASGLCALHNSEKIWRLLGFLNSSLSELMLKAINPTLNLNPGNLRVLPFADTDIDSVVVKQAVTVSRTDWNNFETSWDFRDQPLLRPGLKGATLEASWRNWEAQSTAAIRRMQELETENNRLFIAAYGLDGELQPEVPEAQITLARAEARRDMAAFLSYAVGCMMGRYSPDH